MTAAAWAGVTLTGVMWLLLAPIGAVAVTQAIGWSGMRSVAIAQALTPWLALPGVGLAAIAVATGNVALSVCSVAVVAALAIIVGPAARRRRQARPHSATLRLFHGNLWFENVERAGATADAILACGADVLAMSEFTDHHEQALLKRGAGRTYPHRFGERDAHAEGMVVWSKLPLYAVEAVPMDRRRGIVATVVVGGRSDGAAVRIVLAHPEPPMRVRGLAHWEPSMRVIDSIGSMPGPATVVVADFNAARWHPPFRRRLLRRGWRDAHELVGRGLTASWPVHRRIPGPFIRLDHALLGPGLDALVVENVDVPGSDHRGFVVDLAIVDRAAVDAK